MRHDSQPIHEDSPIEAAELRQLIARLADPAERGNDHRTRVRDIAETMDLDPGVVIEELRRMRREKEEKPIPEEARKLAAILEVTKTPVGRGVTSAPTRRVTIASMTLLLILVFGGFIAMNQVITALGPHTLTHSDHQDKK